MRYILGQTERKVKSGGKEPCRWEQENRAERLFQATAREDFSDLGI